MAALSKFQPVSGNASISHLFYGATTIASLLFVAAFVNIVRKGVPSSIILKSKNVRSWKSSKWYNTMNTTLLYKLHFLLKIIIPRFKCRETFLIALYSVVLLSRTLLSIYVASLEGHLIRTIVEIQSAAFIRYLIKWFLVAIPATFVNSMIKFMEGYVAIAFRARLTQYAYNKYLSDCTYYRVNNLDERLKNVDQCLTDDVMAFCQTTSRLFSLILKPLFDIIFVGSTLVYKSWKAKLGSGIFLLIIMGPGILMSTAGLLRFISPNFSELFSEESKKKGALRFLHSRLISNSEEVALYRGHETEKICLLKAFNNIQHHAYLICRKKIPYIMVEQYLLKYLWTATGMIMIAPPLFTTKSTKASSKIKVGDRTANFMTAKNLMGVVAGAAEKLMISHKEVIELAGYASRVYHMFEVFEDVKQQKFIREKSLENMSENDMVQFDTHEIHGQILQTNGIVRLCDVPIVTPAGHIIVNNFSIEIHAGMHLFITGPNGCGKSSLFRILGGLWPVYRGRLELPPKAEMYYLPQRPYMTFGNLRDQIIYPDTVTDMRRKGITDTGLMEILKTVHLSDIVEREGGFESKREWIGVLSGGEKQRLGLARIFYHQPKYALLDECTSAISIDVEALIYQAMKDAGFTLLSVSHRPSLWRFHTHLLQYDGQGRYRLCPMDSEILQSSNSDMNKNELFCGNGSTKDSILNYSSSINET
ncbi:ABC transporter [Loa loa]|uniref:ABC transporter n=2 Tax=Loa loa TaxID=7209 RepID=A0A1S0TMU0_LOALO|nr:ABC transporter [Loa loa]EFO16988.2 ABC transporter [Loa loa]